MNLVQMIASFLGILSTILLAGYYYYLLSNLDVAEQILLPLKEKYYISLIFPLISTFSMVLLGIAIFSSYLQNDAFILYIYVNLLIMTISFLVLIALLLVKHPYNVKVTINTKDYMIRHVIDNSLLTASPIDKLSQLVDKNKIYTFGINQLKQQQLKVFQEKKISKVETLARLLLISIIFNSLINCFFYNLLLDHWIIRLFLTTGLTIITVVIFIKRNPKSIK